MLTLGANIHSEDQGHAAARVQGRRQAAVGALKA
jgi:hypothetical protein